MVRNKIKKQDLKAFVLVHPGWEKLALQEIGELIKVKGKKAGSGIVEFSGQKEELVFFCEHSQAARRVLVGWGKFPELSKGDFSTVNWEDYFRKGMKFKVEVEGVKGNENRIKLSNNIFGKIFSSLKEKKLELDLGIDFKKPEVIILVYFDGKNYFLGVDMGGRELNKRDYRVFVNSASFKGDLGYYLVRKSGLEKGEKLVVGFVKDGVLAIEAALFNFGKRVNKDLAWEKLPLFEKLELKEEEKEGKGKIYGFDTNMMNIRAAKKNAKIGGVEELMELSRFDLDELDVKFKEGEVDKLIFQVTKKDEDKLNEIYYQASYVLRKKGTLLLMGREGWEITAGEKFKLVSEEVVKKGESGWKVWVMEKK